MAAFDRGTDIEQALRDALTTGLTIPETTPGISANERLQQAVREVVEACRGFFRREQIVDSFTAEEKREMLRGMILTRALDNRLKQFFTGGEVRWGNTSFQGKGFRSLGQEAIYAAPMRLRRGRGGDVISPMIRDLGAALCMHNTPETIRLVLNAQMGKAGPPMNGKDLHVGDFEHGILPAMAPLASCQRSSACRTIRPRSRRRFTSNRRCVYLRTRRSATGFRQSQSTALIPSRSPPPSPGRPNAPERGKDRR